MNGFPVQAAKVHPPPVRDETLRRDRLLDWLHAKIHSRVVLLIAEAGYGKTTLMADFSRRTRVRTLWYRLDETDGDWVSFIGHLVASGRVHDEAFGERTYGLLGEVAAGVATRDAVVAAFVRDLHGLGDAGGALVLDDYHLVDGSADVRQVLREVLARGPERLSIVISSRRAPTLPLGRMRAQGEVAELSVDDLRFDSSETERLFRESYGRPLDGDVLEELHRRTEGWAASLHLVQTAVRDRSALEVRAFVERLSGAEGHLYDYLAEEVLGDLPRDTQSFLMRTSILQLVEPELASLVTGQSREECRSQIEFVERLGLLGRRLASSRAALGFHPLVRDVLRDRLRRESGDEAAETLHRQVAAFAEQRDWHLACHHYAAAGDRDGVQRVVDGALPAIMGSGAFLAAVPYLDRSDPPIESAPAEIVRSRVALANGDADAAVAHALRALEHDATSPWALANLASIHHTAGRVEDAAETARLLRTTASDPDLARIGQTTLALLQGPDQPIGPTIRHLRQFAKEQLDKGRLHYAGIAYLNAAALARIAGDPLSAHVDASEAVAALERSSEGSEIAAARVTRAWALAHDGDLEGARGEMELAVADARPWVKAESAIESALTECWYGSATRARRYVQLARHYLPGASQDAARALSLAEAQLELREGDATSALQRVDGIKMGAASAWPELSVERLSLRAHATALLAAPSAVQDLRAALEAAERQGLGFWIRYLAVTAVVPDEPGPANRRLFSTATVDCSYLSICCELVAPRLSHLAPDVVTIVRHEARRRPERWLPALRKEVDERSDSALVAAELLLWVGEAEDIVRLRRLGRSTKSSRLIADLARGLARRLAPRVFVEDQLRVLIRVGKEETPGTSIRRKVLALMCFLLSRPGYSATRDQVLDALWPDLDPEVAVNSLNQTAYFLRRVFEPNYREEVTPEYLHHHSDLIWLDPDLVSSRSRECHTILGQIEGPSHPDAMLQLSDMYRGKFALDFAYEEWAVPFRESLHTAYLQVIETAVREDTASGHYDRAIRLARRALDVDPDAEQLEVALLRLYRLSGAHAAAAEQYEHYAAVQRAELGVEPPSLDAL